jgi:hypothetical protein
MNDILIKDLAIQVNKINLFNQSSNVNYFNFLIEVENNDFIMNHFEIVVTAMDGDYILDRFKTVFKLNSKEKKEIMNYLDNLSKDKREFILKSVKNTISIEDISIEQINQLKTYKLPYKIEDKKEFIEIDIPNKVLNKNSFFSDKIEDRIKQYFFYYNIDDYSYFNLAEKKLYVHKNKDIQCLEYIQSLSTKKIYSFFELTQKLIESNISYGFEKSKILKEMHQIHKNYMIQNKVFFEVESEDNLSISAIYSNSNNFGGQHANHFKYDLKTIVQIGGFLEKYVPNSFINKLIEYSVMSEKINKF